MVTKTSNGAHFKRLACPWSELQIRLESFECWHRSWKVETNREGFPICNMPLDLRLIPRSIEASWNVSNCDALLEFGNKPNTSYVWHRDASYCACCEACRISRTSIPLPFASWALGYYLMSVQWFARPFIDKWVCTRMDESWRVAGMGEVREMGEVGYIRRVICPILVSVNLTLATAGSLFLPGLSLRQNVLQAFQSSGFR